MPEEYDMQRSWRTDADKLTFIACLPRSSLSKGSPITSEIDDSPDKMIGDINLFLTPADEDPEGCIGELELMIAPIEMRRQGYGRAALLSFLSYLQRHLDDILGEYSCGLESGSSSGEYAVAVNGHAQRKKMRLLQLRVKIGSKNVRSISLFQSVGFVKVGEGENYFGEVELLFEGFLGEARIDKLLEKWHIEGYQEREYTRQIT